MKLEFESGKIIASATEADIHKYLKGEEFTVLSAGEGTYIQVAEQKRDPWEYILEYQEGTTDKHYRAVGKPIALERVLTAFCNYLRGDATWKSDFHWEKMKL